MVYNINMNIASIIISVVIALFGFAGGGGSSSGGGGGGSSSGGSSSYSSSSSSGDSDCEGVECVVGFAFVVVVMVVIALISNSSTKKSLEKSRKKRQLANNSTPQEQQIHAESERIFRAYQEDWSSFNTANIATYTTPRYNNHVLLMLELLRDLHRINKVSSLTVDVVYLKTPVSDSTELPARVDVEFEFGGLDEVLDAHTKKVLYSNRAVAATETWNFIYDGNTLKLDGISQPTESHSHLIRSLAEFSSQYNLYYSPDWGRYALPSRGLIFSNSSMASSDVNNHIIGKWDNLLTQLYTYSAIPGDPSTYYLVGQITLPKSYLGVIVKSRRQNLKVMKRLDKSYDKFELEWPEFNKRYEVYAASADALPAFELLNPKFMEYIYSKNPNLSLEVADNTIYIFANIKSVTEQDYADLLDVLTAAHKELKE